MRPHLLLPLLSALLGGCEKPIVRVGPPPPTAITVVADTMHGTVVEDPYRWLERSETRETRAWIDAQNAYTDAVLVQIPDRERFTPFVTSLMRLDQVDVPTEKGGRYFFSRRRPDDEISILYYREGFNGVARVIVDPHGMSEDHTTSVHLRGLSSDGTLVAYGIRQGGADEVSWRIRDIEAGLDLPDVFPTRRYSPPTAYGHGSVEFTPDGRGLYYGVWGTDNPRIYYHALGTDVAQDREIFGVGYGRADILGVVLSDNGRWLLAAVLHGGGGSGSTELHLKDLQSDADWVEVINDGTSRTFGAFAGDRLLLTTNLAADNWRVMTADLTRPQVAYWTEFLPAREDVIIDRAIPAGGYYFVRFLQNAQSHLAQYDPDGRLVRQIAFETLGSVTGPYGVWNKQEVFVTFSSFHVPTTTYRLDVDTGERELWSRPEIPINTDRFEVEQVWYASKDGTHIPMFVVHRRGLRLNGDHPALLTGYGGFGVSRTPRFDVFAAAWVELGGVFALANLRGGGEFGEPWHWAGRLANKQNVFDDFIAAAEYLIADGYTQADRLAISGSSNGGLLVGAVMTQRPDLFGAVICGIPLLDMLRYERFLVGSLWVDEYGSATDPEQFQYLRAYSPYHNVVPGTRYPATLFVTGDLDTRVDPLHARKMTALLQAATAGDGPILLHYYTQFGHSGGESLSKDIQETVDQLAFLWWRVGRT